MGNDFRQSLDRATQRIEEIIDAAEQAAEGIRADAEQEARGYLEEAQREADRLTAERVRMISELTDSLIQHASEVKQQSEGMIGALETAIDRIGEIAEHGESPGVPSPPWPAASRRRERAPERDRPQEAPEREESREAPEREESREAPEREEPRRPREAELARDEAAEAPPGVAAFGGSQRAHTGEAQGRPDREEAILRATQMAVSGSDRDEIEQVLREELGFDEARSLVDEILGPRA